MTDHQAFVDARNAKLSANTRQLFAEVDEALADVLTVANESIPEAYQSHKYDDETTDFNHLIKKTQVKTKTKRELRGISVKFETVNGKREIVESTPERLAAIENYRKQVEAGCEKLSYDVDEDGEYRHLMAFAKVAVAAGILSEDDFVEE